MTKEACSIVIGPLDEHIKVYSKVEFYIDFDIHIICNIAFKDADCTSWKIKWKKAEWVHQSVWKEQRNRKAPY